MHSIDVDEEVYAHLERHVVGFEQPNDVLRRLLLSAPGQPAAKVVLAAHHSSRSGVLEPLLLAGVIAAGDTLSHEKVRTRRRYVATVEADGWLRTDQDRYRTPSAALAAQVGTPIDGWAFWIHERSGKSLRQLRAEIGGKPRGY